VVKPLLSSHPQGISEWLLNRGTKLPNRGLPEISFRFEENPLVETSFIQCWQYFHYWSDNWPLNLTHFCCTKKKQAKLTIFLFIFKITKYLFTAVWKAIPHLKEQKMNFTEKIVCLQSNP